MERRYIITINEWLHGGYTKQMDWFDQIWS